MSEENIPGWGSVLLQLVQGLVARFDKLESKLDQYATKSDLADHKSWVQEQLRVQDKHWGDRLGIEAQARIDMGHDLAAQIEGETSEITTEQARKEKFKRNVVYGAWTVGSVIFIGVCTLLAPSVHVHF